MSQKASRPRSRGQAGPVQQQEPKIAPAKIFNCIVDETALIQGAKKSTRDGIPKWVAAGRIRLFVPLYALTQASRVKTTKGRAASDASEALEWLDESTTAYPHLVTLQGGYDKFETWAEVEKFALPRTLFSEEDDGDDHDIIASLQSQTEGLAMRDEGDDTRYSVSSNNSMRSASSHPSVRSRQSESPSSCSLTQTSNSLTAMVEKVQTEHKSLQTIPKDLDTPRSVQPLFNYIIWRVHQETDPAAALDSFIFLSDNSAVRKHAQRFGIRSKTLSEIRYVIARESQDDRNRQYVQQKGKSQITSSRSNSSFRSGKDLALEVSSNGQENIHNVKPLDVVGDHCASDEDEILLKRAPKAPAALISSPKVQSRVIDPNQFQRHTTRGPPSQARGSGRGQARPTTPRGRGGPSNRGRGSNTSIQPSEPIDPDSFSRPSSGRGATRGGRGLWIPT